MPGQSLEYANARLVKTMRALVMIRTRLRHSDKVRMTHSSLSGSSQRQRSVKRSGQSGLVVLSGGQLATAFP